jgi:hypothetical protein
MKARAETIGADLAVRTRPGRGTTIEVTVPSGAAVPDVAAAAGGAAASNAADED